MSLPDPALDALPPLCIRLDETVPVLIVPADLGFEEVREWLRARLPGQTDTIAGRAARLDLGGREIKLFDLRRMLHVLRDEFQIDVTGLYVRPSEVHRYAERELKLKLFLAEPAPAAPPAAEAAPVEADATPAADSSLAADSAEAGGSADADDVGPESLEADDEAAPARPVAIPVPDLGPAKDPADPSRRTLALHRTLRSGASIRFDGDVIVYGDVNPGAQIVASGNIVVLGALKGMAHAGATGDEEAFILGFELRPTQLRIGRKIAMPPDRPAENRQAETEIAHVVDAQIVIEPYRGRSR